MSAQSTSNNSLLIPKTLLIGVALFSCLVLPQKSQAARLINRASVEVVLPQSQHARHKLQHEQRQKAARRLKAAYTQVKAIKMARDVTAFGHFRRAK